MVGENHDPELAGLIKRSSLGAPDVQRFQQFARDDEIAGILRAAGYEPPVRSHSSIRSTMDGLEDQSSAARTPELVEPVRDHDLVGVGQGAGRQATSTALADRPDPADASTPSLGQGPLAPDGKRDRRGVASSIGPHVGPTVGEALVALGPPVDPKIDAEEVERIASEGFPLWEPVDVMVLRNRRITLAYSILSRRLADLITGPDGVRDANWCTFATWSSKTIGTLIERIPSEIGGNQVTDGRDSTGNGDEGHHAGVNTIRTGPLPGYGSPSGAVRLGRLRLRPVARSRSSMQRALVAANRVVFLEVGLVVTTFLGRFGEHAADEFAVHEQWDACWKDIQGHLADLHMLDPSWMLTPTLPMDSLRLGMQQYLKALHATDQHQRSQHVLTANLLLADYEQRRVDGYIRAALALFTERAMRRLIRDRTAAIGGVRSWPTGLYARYMTRRMTLRLGDEVLRISEPIPLPRDPDDRWQELTTNADVTLPVLQALITRYQLALGRLPNRGATNWTSFDQRMRTIGNLFRLRQRQQSLFADPFDEYETAHLLSRRPERVDDHTTGRRVVI